MLINGLPTDLNVDIVNHVVTNVVDPTSRRRTSVSTTRTRIRQSRQINLQVTLVDQITVTRNGTRDLASKVHRAIERLLNALQGNTD